MKSERNTVRSIDKIGWEFYIAGVLPIGGGSGRCMERRNHGGGGVTMSDFSIGLSASARTGAEV